MKRISLLICLCLPWLARAARLAKMKELGLRDPRWQVSPQAGNWSKVEEKAWANVSNTPCREYKHWEHEGGISTPLIARWPAGMKTGRQGDGETGRLVHTPTLPIDLMATCVDVGGATYPASVKDKPIFPIKGRSLKPLIVSLSDDLPISRFLFWEHEGNCAIRVGGWELHDMAAHRAEMHDLAAQQPERVKDLAAQWEAWTKRVGVLPWPLGGGNARTGKGRVKQQAK